MLVFIPYSVVLEQTLERSLEGGRAVVSDVAVECYLVLAIDNLNGDSAAREVETLLSLAKLIDNGYSTWLFSATSAATGNSAHIVAVEPLAPKRFNAARHPPHNANITTVRIVAPPPINR